MLPQLQWLGRLALPIDLQYGDLMQATAYECGFDLAFLLGDRKAATPVSLRSFFMS